MPNRTMVTVDGNEAAASVAHRTNEVCIIYPITPSSPMGELCDDWSAMGKENIWGQVPDITEMQSEAGAAGGVHGALQAGALTTTFTASQGLLLMIPNMYKIAGELNGFCMHVTARTLATHALSIFGDHSDVMACRQTGFAMLCSASVQEAHDFALVSQAATLHSRIPFLHFFDGFRTSHEVAKIEQLEDDDLRAMVTDELVAEHRKRALTPDAPKVRGTAQNPDTFFQAREACNPYHNAVPGIVEKVFEQFASLTGRRYGLFDYFGAEDAEDVIVMMGSGTDVAHEAIEVLNESGYKAGLVKVRLFRPFDVRAFLASLPRTVRRIAVLDRTKEPGAAGEPLYLEVVAALRQARRLDRQIADADPMVIGGRYGLASKEFTPAMVKGVYDLLKTDDPIHGFTVGIVDDVTHLSIPFDADFSIDPEDVTQCMFYGLGADGTVGANKNSIKIIGEQTDHYAQGYFVYDSKKSGAMTVSHLRFGPRPIRSAYLVTRADFIACSQFNFLEKFDVLAAAKDGATFLLNAPFDHDKVWDRLPLEIQQTILDKKLKVYVIDAQRVADQTGMGRRTNTIMQTCFFAISGVLPREEAIDRIKQSVEKTYGRKGAEVVRRNFQAVDETLANLRQLDIPQQADSRLRRLSFIQGDAPDFVTRVSAVMMEGKGDDLPVSAFPADGTWPMGTTKYEKRNIALEIPIWDEQICIQCNKCAFVCPHAAIRAKAYSDKDLADAPDTFQSMDYKAKDLRGLKFTIQVAPEDCTGCGLCVAVCPAKNKSEPRRRAINMEPHAEHVARERENYRFFLDLPDIERSLLQRLDVKGTQFLQPLFEYSGACSGCGETPYVKLATQLFGDRALIANATGCSSIYGGNLPTTPYCANDEGRGPAWSNSLFEDNAEFGFGMRLAIDALIQQARYLVKKLAPKLGDRLVGELLEAIGRGDEAGLAEQRGRIAELKRLLEKMDGPEAARLLLIADYLSRKSVWLFGGDGWAYDIGFGGLDHVFSQLRDVNILVLDTEVYSNTGGQASKSTPLGAAAKFAAAGKATNKKDLGLIAMSYGHVYVASVAMGANDNHTAKVFLEAESYPGPSLIIAYSHCIAHGYDMIMGLDQQKRAVESGIWPLYRFDPRLIAQGKPPLQLDSGAAKIAVSDYMRNEARFRMVEKIDPARFRMLAQKAQEHTTRRVSLYKQLSALVLPVEDGAPSAATPAQAN
ncbi:MAG: pyruvate:ferredoxin (flavodoxin) oxidoreductase [Phycisphaeraceae bacterium]|nr:pyruvate:ferredoxin (flavodoxin) oxidoreductase [Phycisphaeraceae bacterium]